MTGPAPDLGARLAELQQLAAVLDEHALAAFTGTESACACDRRWRPNREYRMHLAVEILDALAGEGAAR